MPDNMAWEDAGTGGNVDARGEAEVFQLPSRSCSAVSGYLVLCVFGGFYFKLLNTELAKITGS